MTEARQWLNEKHPLNQREQIEEINNSYGGELTGELTIENFPNLKKVNLAKNKSITKLIIRNCPQVEKIDVQNNQIAELVINELTNLEHLNCSNNQLTKLDVELNTKIKELFFSDNPHLRKENIKGLEKLTQLVSFKCDEGLQPIQFLQNQLQQPQQQENNNQTRWLQKRNQELITQIQEIQEKLAVFEILSLEEKIRIQKNYVESLKTKARIRLDPNLHEILKDLLEAQEELAKGENRLVQRLFDRSKQDLVRWLPERETDKLLQAISNLNALEMRQNQEQQALIEMPTRINQ